MTLFIITFASIYTGMHVVFYRSARYLLPPGLWLRLALWAFFAVMIASPVLTVAAGSAGFITLAKVLAAVGYAWMGFIIISLVCLLVLGLLRLVVLIVNRRPWQWRRPVAIALGAAFLISAYALWSATNVQLERLEIVTDKLPAGVQSLRIVQTTDMHLGYSGGRTRLARVLKLVKEAKPDIWVDTGDMWDRPLLHAHDLVAMMRQVRPPLGKYFVTGNHEKYVGQCTSLSLARAAGFYVLEDSGLSVAGLINLAGVCDTRRLDPVADRAAMKGLDPALYTIFMRHRPLVSAHTEKLADLQLSGHTHGGQIFPGPVLVLMAFDYLKGLYKLDHSLLYISRGSGTWGPPMRLLSPPEVTLIILKRPPSAGQAK